jgi:hypothetical protein
MSSFIIAKLDRHLFSSTRSHRHGTTHAGGSGDSGGGSSSSGGVIGDTAAAQSKGLLALTKKVGLIGIMSAMLSSEVRYVECLLPVDKRIDCIASHDSE